MASQQSPQEGDARGNQAGTGKVGGWGAADQNSGRFTSAWTSSAGFASSRSCRCHQLEVGSVHLHRFLQPAWIFSHAAASSQTLERAKSPQKPLRRARRSNRRFRRTRTSLKLPLVEHRCMMTHSGTAMAEEKVIIHPSTYAQPG